MPRTARAIVGGDCYHVLNRGNGRAAVFHQERGYATFTLLLRQASLRVPMRLLAYCLTGKENGENGVSSKKMVSVHFSPRKWFQFIFLHVHESRKNEPTPFSRQLGLEDTLRPRGRPPKAAEPHDATSPPPTLFS